ncbi:MAG TPA: acyl-CoA dehydrogenase family protein [Candidatus Binatus sp.]|uniref:acyl-CoA dehydrogenase family protein n=1 Tax=Candidatus Binatus sp. TaxID=2811406 RepID=UPI002B460CBC|nr:acyl-CoA dehydrogenase family protein [Candidatus Binatus sp.]HKN14677.1 acyl-CoA dehydrogenase family protein [Candidatus Binatus sp.]
MPLVTPEHEFIRRSVREFVEAEVKPIANDLDRQNKEIPERILKQMADLGYFGVIFPAEEGGMGLDYISMAIVTEELSRGWLSVGSVMTRNIITGTLISANGTPEQKKKFLPPIARGEILTAAAFTEPDSGSDTASFKTHAVKDGDGYLIKGSKMWCTFANRAHMLTVMTRTDPDMSKKHKGLSLILFEKKPGDDFMPPQLTGSPIPTIGYHGMRSYALQFDDAFAPKANLIGGQEGRGFYQLMASYEAARIQTAARGVGVAQAAFECAVKYAKDRKQFGQPIGDFQVIRHKLAHMAVEIEAARQLCYFAAAEKDTGKRCDYEAGLAKAFAAEMAERVTREAMQVHGGYGYSMEFEAQRFWRDARVLSIFEGTSEIQYEVIGRRIMEQD